MAQFGSTTMSGEPLNQTIPTSISVGKLTGPLPHKSSTMGTEGAISAWRKQGPLPFSSKTSKSTFDF